MMYLLIFILGGCVGFLILGLMVSVGDDKEYGCIQDIREVNEELKKENEHLYNEYKKWYNCAMDLQVDCLKYHEDNMNFKYDFEKCEHLIKEQQMTITELKEELKNANYIILETTYGN